MKYAFFGIPVRFGEEATDALNHYLASNRIITVTQQFVAHGTDAGWAFSVEVDLGEAAKKATRPKSKIDYREILNSDDFAVFARLREWRKERADQDELPAYAILTNEQMAEVARQRPKSLGQLSEINGIGTARIQKFGASLIAFMANKTVLESGQKEKEETK